MVHLLEVRTEPSGGEIQNIVFLFLLPSYRTSTNNSIRYSQTSFDNRSLFLTIPPQQLRIFRFIPKCYRRQTDERSFKLQTQYEYLWKRTGKIPSLTLISSCTVQPNISTS